MPFKDPEQRRAYNRAYQKLNRERLRPLERAKAQRYARQRSEYKKAWYSRPEVKDRIAAQVKVWQESHREERCESAKRWKLVHDYKRDSVNRRAEYARRRAQSKSAPGRFTQKDWLARLEYYGFRCAYCRVPVTKKTAHADHIIPISRGGSNWPSNIAPACRFCNLSKGAKRILPLPASMVKES